MEPEENRVKKAGPATCTGLSSHVGILTFTLTPTVPEEKERSRGGLGGTAALLCAFELFMSPWSW